VAHLAWKKGSVMEGSFWYYFSA